MRRVNISNDVESRRRIASATPQIPGTAPEAVATNNIQEDAQTEEVQGSEDNAPTQTEPDTPPKRGRKTGRDAEKV